MILQAFCHVLGSILGTFLGQPINPHFCRQPAATNLVPAGTPPRHHAF